MDALLDRLNSQQQLAVAAPAGPTLVLAGPGSGKTRVLTYRIAYLISVFKVPAHNILAVTFTNKAAKQMGERMTKLIGPNSEGIWLGTFHAICGRILRREADLLPVTKNFVIFDTDDQQALMKEILRDNNLDEKLYKPASILAAISNAKNDLILPEAFPVQNFRDEQTKRLYALYQQRLVKNNAMDFDDMLVYTNQLFESYPVVRDTYGHKFEHILVDEFQDTNYSQYAILRNLARVHKNLYVVGDEDQSIYRWRGADYRNIERFKKDFKDAEVILLEQNYRSTQTILDSAVAVIDQNSNRTRKKLFTQAQTGEKIRLIVAEDDREEAQLVVSDIRDGIRARQNPSDFAIMYRTNAQSRLLEEAFRRECISYRLVGAQRFYGRKEVRDMIAFFRLIYNPLDEISLKRVINLPPRGIGDKTLQALAELAEKSGLSLGESLLDLNRPDNQVMLEVGRGGERLSRFAHMLSGWRKTAQDNSLSVLFDRIVSDTDYETYIQDKSEEGQDRWENVLELRAVVMEYETRGLQEFLEAMALVADQDTLPETLDAPTMLTLHAAKGLEFERVYIIGLDEMLLPHSRSCDDEEDLAEERRLLYVGITRAKKKLTLTRAQRRRSPYGTYEDTIASRFIKDLPSSLLKQDIYAQPRRNNFARENEYSRWESPSWLRNTTIPQDKPAKTKFKSGMQVRHSTYGRGVVKNSKLEYGDETVEVYFEGHGLKALIASMAKLDIL
ncbi:MAG TPA: UvrD-helicase domain-containing protein [Chloroflexi bacterium]|nr:UvrD-helicase domain-containing protein [Anaerolineaceae bacterium]HHX07829.1 UvrD-helicase domain-containing protein [Chloroflexota bacterium]